MSNLSSFVKRIRDIMRNDAGINGDAQRIEQIAWMLFLKVYDAKEQDWEINDDDYESIIPEECRWINWAHDDRSGSAMTGDTLLNFVNNTLFPTLKNLEVDPETPIKKSIVKTTFEDANQYMKDGVLLRQVINIIDELDLGDYEESHAFGEIYESTLRELQSASSSGEFYTPRAVTDFMAKMIRPKIGETCADFACGTGGFLTSWLKELSPQIGDSEEKLAQYNNSIYGIEKKQFPYMLCITNMLLHDIDVPQVYHENALIRDVLDYTEDDQFSVILMNPPYGGSEKTEVKNHFPADLMDHGNVDACGGGQESGADLQPFGMDGFDAALFQFVGTHAVDTFHHDIAHDDGRGRPGQGLETDLEAGILLQAGQVGGNDRNLLHTGLFQGPADKAHIVGGPAASACLGHDHGRLVEVVSA